MRIMPATLCCRTTKIAAATATAMALSVAGCSDPSGNRGGVHQRWYQAQSGYGYSRPGTNATMAFFGTGDGKVVARDKGSGALRWVAQVSGGAIGGANMVVRGGAVIVPLTLETVALDTATGKVRWRYSAPLDTVLSGGTAPRPGQVFLTHLDSDSELVFVPAWGASVSAVDIATGTVRWVWQPGPGPSDTAASGVFRSGSEGARVHGDTVYATVWHDRDAAGLHSEAWLVAIDRVTGAELWRAVMPSYTSGAMITGAPAVSDNLVIFESVGGHEYAIDRFTQQLVWEYKPNTKAPTAAQTELYGGVVYHDGGDHNIYALRATDGSVIWRAPFSTQTSRDLLVTERRVIFTNGGTLYVLDRQSGRQLAAVAQPNTYDSFFASAAAYSGGQVFVTVGDGAWSFDEP